MAHINFVIPHKFEDLLKDQVESYYVKETIEIGDLPAKIREAKLNFKDEGVSYIFDYFDTYYSIIHHKAVLSLDKLLLVHDDLQIAVSALTQNLKFLLEDIDNLTAEIKLKYQTIVKMLLYLFCTHIMAIDSKNSANDLQLVMKKRARKRAAPEDKQTLDKKSALITINMLLQCDIYLFWDPPVVEEQIINLVAEVCYPILENNSISSNKELLHEIFNIFGILLKTYSYDESFLIRLVQLLKVHPHLIKPTAEGIHQLVQNFGTKGLIGEFIREIMEFLMDEKYEDAEGTRNCTATLLEMSKLLPQLMIPEIVYLNNYLGHESPALRVAVLTVMSEVLIILGVTPELEDNKEMLKDFISKVLLAHINDVAITVRAKVMQIWARVQKENLLNTHLQNDALKDIVAHISDKGSSVRKNAAICVISFLEHNPYGSELSLKRIQMEYETRLKEFQETEENIKKMLCPEKVTGIEEEWNAIEADILKAPKEKPKRKSARNNDDEEMTDGDSEEDGETEENDKDMSEEELQQEASSQALTGQLITLITMQLQAKQYKEAFALCKRLSQEVPEYTKMRREEPETSDEQFLLKLMKGFHMQMSLQIHHLVDADTIKRMDELEESVKYYGGAVDFAKSLEKAMTIMTQLLTSVNVTEMQEAVKFFVIAYKFQIDGSEHGVLELLDVMKLPYEERKAIVIDALVEVFLVTTLTNNMKEHVTVIVERLIRFVRIVTYDYRFAFQEMIAQWTLKGKLDNSILDMLFSYFIKKEPVTDDQSLAALQVLTLAAYGRKSIVTNNLKMVSEVVFQNRGLNDMVLVAETCNFLAVGGIAKHRIDDDKPPFRLSYTEPLWNQLSNILFENFSKPVQFYDAAVAAAFRMIYNLCSKPETICQDLIMRIMSLDVWSAPTSILKVPTFYVNRLNFMLGKIAVYETAHLDDTVYTEIKRRARKKELKGNRRRVDDLEITRASARRRASKASGANEDPDESILEGAQADDADAQFVLNTLEYKIVTNRESLGAFTPFFLEICHNFDKFPNEQVQCASVLVLLRYMIMSDQMCRQHVGLIFRMLATAKYVSVKRIIIINVADLLARFPNVIDPYSSQVFERLSDADETVQKTTYFILANLLTRGMLRVNKKVYPMALPMVPEQTPLSNMAKQFFSQLANNQQTLLYNLLPDLFSFVCARKDVSEEQLQHIMKYLFSLTDKNKYMESLVDRFSAKLVNNEDEYALKNIGFCLHLIHYNDKSARKLADNFANYKDALLNTDLHAFFKQIMAGWSKVTKYNLKEIATELDAKIVDFFEIKDINAEDAGPSMEPGSSRKGRSAKKPNRGRRKTKRLG